MKKLAGMAGPSITLVVALVMLFTSLAALLLANSLRGQLGEAQGQLQDTQSELQEMQAARDLQQKMAKGGAGSAGREPGTVNKSQSQDNTKGRTQQDPKSSTRSGQGQQQAILIGLQEDGVFSLPYLLLLSLGLVVVGSLALVVVSALTLLSGGWKSSRAGPGTERSTPETSNLERSRLLDDERWMKLVEECVDVVDELDEHMDSFDAPRQEVAGHVIMRLEEILGRSGVEVISHDTAFDRSRHKPDSTQVVTENGVAIQRTLSPGFAVGSRVLRRARVWLE